MTADFHNFQLGISVQLLGGCKSRYWDHGLSSSSRGWHTVIIRRGARGICSTFGLGCIGSWSCRLAVGWRAWTISRLWSSRPNTLREAAVWCVTGRYWWCSRWHWWSWSGSWLREIVLYLLPVNEQIRMRRKPDSTHIYNRSSSHGWFAYRRCSSHCRSWLSCSFSECLAFGCRFVAWLVTLTLQGCRLWHLWWESWSYIAMGVCHFCKRLSERRDGTHGRFGLWCVWVLFNKKGSLSVFVRTFICLLGIDIVRYLIFFLIFHYKK